jgi:Tol biopolymer transport system component
VLTAHRVTASGPVNLSLFETDSAQSCSLVRRYSSLSDSSTAVATAFSVSPDETQIAFTSFDPATQDASFYGGGITVGYIYVAPVDGTSPPVRISNDPAIYGPRWIAGGHLLAFTKLDSFGDANAPPPTSIVVISPEGGTETVVDHADGVNTTVALSSTLGCDISNQPVGAGAIALLSVIAIANLLVRRKRRA